MKKIELLLKQIWESKIAWCAFFLVALLPIVFSLVKGGVGDNDSAFYLLYVGKIAEGYVPNLTIKLGYTPLWFYLMYIISYPFGISCYNPEYFLFFHYLFVLCIAYFIYKITIYFSHNKQFALLAAWLFLMISHWIQGNIILLEIPSVFFGLLAVTCILYHDKKSDSWYILYGILSASAFLVKQFGLGFSLLCALLILFEKYRGRKLAYYAFGYLIPIIIYFCILGKYFIPVIFSSYGTTTAIEAGYDKTIGSIINDWFDSLVYVFKRIIPAFLGIFLFAFIPFKDKTKRKEWLFCLCGFFGFSLQFIFTQGLHYCQYLIPFAIILAVLLTTYKTKKILKVVQYLLIGVTIVLGLYSTYHNRVYKMYYRGTQNIRSQIANNVKNIVGENKSLWIAHGGLFYVYYYGQLTPPNIQKYGYSFGPLGTSKKMAWEQASTADYVLKFNETYPYDYYLSDSLCNFVESHFAIPISKHITLYDMSKPK